MGVIWSSMLRDSASYSVKKSLVKNTIKQIEKMMFSKSFKMLFLCHEYMVSYSLPQIKLRSISASELIAKIKGYTEKTSNTGRHIMYRAT